MRSNSHKKKKQRYNNRTESPDAASTTSAGPADGAVEDFTKVKVTSQTPITVFWNHVDWYFKPFTEDDLHLLEEVKVEMERKWRRASSCWGPGLNYSIANRRMTWSHTLLLPSERTI
jgi:hypothetical protein